LIAYAAVQEEKEYLENYNVDGNSEPVTQVSDIGMNTSTADMIFEQLTNISAQLEKLVKQNTSK
tara:strand:+ start:32 stop:223 length:192 start_codon:yes stop_codon:yes gene_type:complete